MSDAQAAGGEHDLGVIVEVELNRVMISVCEVDQSVRESRDENLPESHHGSS